MRHKIYEEWFKKGNNDITSAKILLKEKSPNETICFLSQQSIEKYLKGYLTFKKKKFKKTHDLVDLLELCTKIDEEFEKFVSDCNTITSYYIPTRYPSIFLEKEISEKDAKYSVEKAIEIKIFILEKINKNKEVDK